MVTYKMRLRKRLKRIQLLLFIIPVMIFSILLSTGCGNDETDSDQNLSKDEKYIHLATTTSTYDSGLLDFLNPVFTEETGIAVRVISQGTGAALETGRRGDADLLLVHDRDTELAMVEEGYFVDRHDLMYNDFIIAGPESDPAGIRKAESVKEACILIAESSSKFVSRGDDSGTHRVEENLWNEAGIETKSRNWYYSIGQGMGDTLRFANEVLGYTLTDRGTFEAIRAGLDLKILYEGDPALYNYYGIMAVNPSRHPHVKYDYAMEYINFLISETGRELIESYEVNNTGLFFTDIELD